MAKIYFKRGSLYTKMKNYAQANADFTRAIELTQDNDEKITALLLRAKSHHTHQQFKKALADYISILKFNNANTDTLQIYQNIAQIYLQTNSYNDAIAFYTNAIKLNPNNTNLHISIAKVYLKKNDKQLGFKHIQKAQNLEPDNVNIYLLKAEYYSYQANKNSSPTFNINLALSEHQKVIELNPTYIPNYFKIAQLYIKKTQYQKAINNYTILLSLDKENIQAHLQRADTFIKLKKYPEAIIDLYDAIRFNKDKKMAITLQKKIDSIKNLY
jgi:tetratricopeptide (TPR) repeat protein